MGETKLFETLNPF